MVFNSFSTSVDLGFFHSDLDFFEYVVISYFQTIKASDYSFFKVSHKKKKTAEDQFSSEAAIVVEWWTKYHRRFLHKERSKIHCQGSCLNFPFDWSWKIYSTPLQPIKMFIQFRPFYSVIIWSIFIVFGILNFNVLHVNVMKII